jgi:hypothetical protein
MKHKKFLFLAVLPLTVSASYATDIAASAEFADVVSAVGTVGVLIAGVVVVKRGARMLLGMIAPRSSFHRPD